MEMLKIKMVTLDRCVVMYILEQDESLRGMDDVLFGNFMFLSNCYPAIANDMVYLRGKDRKRDTKPSFSQFNSNEERDEWLKDFREAFNAFEEYLLKNRKTEDKSVPDDSIKNEIFTIPSKGE